MTSKRISSWKEIIWGKAMKVGLALYSFVGFFDLMKSEFLPEKYQSWTIVKLIPLWSWKTWLILLLLLLVGILLEGAHAAIDKRDREHNATKLQLADLKSELERLSKPRFSGRFTNRAIAPFPAGLRGEPAFAGATAIAHLELELLNSGAPSVAIDWACELHCDGKLVRTVLYYPSAKYPVTLDSEPPTTLTLRDFLAEKTAQPIPAGARVIGWLGVVIFGPTRDEAGHGSWSFHCYDVTRQRHTFELTEGALGAPGLSYQPGR